jgi:hypothetical protein
MMRPFTLTSVAIVALGAVFAPSAQAKFVAVFEETEAFGLPAVQEIGDGTIDLTDLGPAGSSANGVRGSVSPQTGTTVVGGNGSSNLTFFDNAVITGPSNFGVGPGAFADRMNGNAVIESLSFIGVPQGYSSGASLFNRTTFINATYASLGMTPGVYVWSWGSGSDADSFTIDIAAPVPLVNGMPDFQVFNSTLAAELPLPTEFTFSVLVPEPSTWAMMLLGFAGLGYAAVRRKGAVHAISS